MIFELIYCPACDKRYPRIGDGNVLIVPCGHPVREMVRLDLETVGGHRHFKMWRHGKWPIQFWLRPDGNGGRRVEYKKGKQKNARLYSVGGFLPLLAGKSLAAAFEAMEK